MGAYFGNSNNVSIFWHNKTKKLLFQPQDFWTKYWLLEYCDKPYFLVRDTFLTQLESMYLAKLWLLVLGMVQEAKTIVLLDMVKNSQVHLDKEIFVPLNGFTFCLQFYLESLDEHWVLFKALCLKITKSVSCEFWHFYQFLSYLILNCLITLFYHHHPKWRIWLFQFWHFPLIFVL